MFKLYLDLAEYKRPPAALIFLDLSAAFDSVVKDLLLAEEFSDELVVQISKKRAPRLCF